MLLATHSSSTHRYACEAVTPTAPIISTALYCMPVRKCERASWPNEYTSTTTALAPAFSAIVAFSSVTVYSSASSSTPAVKCSVATPSTTAVGSTFCLLSTTRLFAFR